MEGKPGSKMAITVVTNSDPVHMHTTSSGCSAIHTGEDGVKEWETSKIEILFQVSSSPHHQSHQAGVQHMPNIEPVGWWTHKEWCFFPDLAKPDPKPELLTPPQKSQLCSWTIAATSHPVARWQTWTSAAKIFNLTFLLALNSHGSFSPLEV